MIQSDYDKKLKNINCNVKLGSNNVSLPPSTKWNLANVKSINTKALDCHLDNMKFSGDSIQDIILLHSNIA